jgi:hypothetical protein
MFTHPENTREPLLPSLPIDAVARLTSPPPSFWADTATPRYSRAYAEAYADRLYGPATPEPESPPSRSPDTPTQTRAVSERQRARPHPSPLVPQPGDLVQPNREESADIEYYYVVWRGLRVGIFFSR